MSNSTPPLHRWLIECAQTQPGDQYGSHRKLQGGTAYLDEPITTLKKRANPSGEHVRHSWPETHHRVELKSARIAVLKAPRIPTLADRMARFLARLSHGTAEEASKALNELGMMVTAETIERGISAAEILTPIAVAIVGRWPVDQVDRERMKLLEQRNSLAGGKTRDGIVNLVLDLFDEELRCHAELGKHFY